jgi:acetylglutamate kinase
MSNHQEIITRLLRNLGSRREVEQYLRQYSAVDGQKFAIIKVGGGILRDDLDSLTSALTFLFQVGLMPIVIHGGGPQLDEALEAEGVTTARVDGLRVTDARTLEVARRVFLRENLALVAGLEALGARARPVLTGVFEAEIAHQGRLGLVGEVTRVHLEAIDACLNAGVIPVLSCLGESPGGQILNLNADVAAQELAKAIKPHKIIFLTPTGGLLDQRGHILPAVNLAEDFSHLMQQPWVSGGMRLKLQEINKLLDALPLDSSVSITSPDHLARELFTHRGSGTLIRRGERVLRHSSLDGLDRDRLRDLLESCFQKTLAPDYFKSKAFLRIYNTESYRGAAILTQEVGIPYLDKFAVTQRAQGEGLGGSIWQRMTQDHPKLFWRARQSNEVNPWYFKHSQGAFRSGEWVVFWYGLQGFDEIKLCVERALALPATLHKEVP